MTTANVSKEPIDLDEVQRYLDNIGDAEWLKFATPHAFFTALIPEMLAELRDLRAMKARALSAFSKWDTIAMHNAASGVATAQAIEDILTGSDS